MATRVTLAAELAAFIREFTGLVGVGDTEGNRGQCVGLAECWIDQLKLPHVWGNAKDLLDNAPTGSYTVIRNKPTNFPAPGDIVVWGPTWGEGFGHTGIAVTGGVMQFDAFEQNDPEDSPPHLKKYGYDGVLGWLRPVLKS
jgi:hypothetical protein